MSGTVVWFTGLSGAGKTTISQLVAEKLQARNVRHHLLDGDEVRAHLTKDLGFSKADRFTNIERVAYVANLLTQHDLIVLASFITPYQNMRDYCRKTIRSYVEVYVKCSLEECIRRDVKGMYQRALKREINHFTGISDPFETPLAPELILHSDKVSAETCANQVITFLEQAGYIRKH